MEVLPPYRKTLLEARKVYSKCANKVENNITQRGLTPLLSSQVIGIGIASDWLRRAAEMDNIHYIGKNLNKSKSSELFIELLRFSFSWFALNSIFSRTELLNLFGEPSGNGEYKALSLLYSSSSLINAPQRLEELRLILNTPITTRLPNNNGIPVSTLEAIYLKYLPNGIKGSAAKDIKLAVESGSANSLEMPTLIYAFRNWSVHGNTMHGCFGSHPRFLRYASLLQETLAELHYDIAVRLRNML
jgi:hypothetical protein